MFRELDLASHCRSIIADVRDLGRLSKEIGEARPEFVFHLAAQPLVLESYRDPLTTISTNVTGTANLMEALRLWNQPCTVIVVTSDKCYENREWDWAYRESDALGGHDVYSASKAAAELVVSSFRRSFFSRETGIAVATARAGNVIGGGDRAEHRIVPDCIRALSAGSPILVRNPGAVRPWQHVLEPLGGYLLLAARVSGGDGGHSEAWNFGPQPGDSRSVESLVKSVVARWGGGTWTFARSAEAGGDSGTPHEARALRLAIDKAVARLDWKPRWPFEEAVVRTVDWYKAAAGGCDASELQRLTRSQIEAYTQEDSGGTAG